MEKNVNVKRWLLGSCLEIASTINSLGFVYLFFLFFKLSQTIKGHLNYLPAIADFLVEDTKFITNSVTVGSQAKRGHRVQKAS